ncbi:uncharacterized protein LOC131665291 [Phymastichus coffea]|uniref:uncharacterized protein LOC131665291 n=1 Tax=Phymastichus coffea TaxID=108790 RepID=UPI00273AF282|nr:uncharacterized protein LOC131665291 [Phymastichus coffea]
MTCNKNNKNNIYLPKYRDHLAHLYSSEVHNALIDILNDDIENKKNPLNAERTLFQNCMRLGNNKTEENNVDSEGDKPSQENTDNTKLDTIESYFNSILEYFDQKIDEENWQKLDQKLALLGFKHSFFEIDVVKDPANPNKNIIRLSPPSIKEWNFKKLTDIVSDIFTQLQIEALDYCKGNKNSEPHESEADSSKIDNDSAFWESDENKIDESNAEDNTANSTPVDPICETILEEESELTTRLVHESDQNVMDLLNKVLQGIFDTMDTSNKESKVQRLTIQEWNTVYEKYSSKNTTKINWPLVLKSYFKNVGVYIENTDYILIENLPYFYKMAELFGDSSNANIVHALRSKFVAENMRYWSWEYVYQINPVDKTSFCLEDNKFYAASTEVLKRLKLKMRPYKKKIESLLNSIASVEHANISRAKLSETDKSYLLSNLKDFTKNPFETTDHSIISEYYKDFEITGVYLVDINSYNSLMRKKNLQKLHDTSIKHHRSSPFSVLEIENPRNRYIIHSALNAIIYRNEFSHNKAALYGTFGVKSASFLFSLLAEKTYVNDLRDFRGVLSITPRISYNPEYVSCFIQENSVKYGYPVVYDIITEVFSIRFAYEALLHCVKAKSSAEFFVAYTEDHCGENDKQMIKKVLSNVVEFSNAFECLRNENTVCHLKAF